MWSWGSVSSSSRSWGSWGSVVSGWSSWSVWSWGSWWSSWAVDAVWSWGWAVAWWVGLQGLQLLGAQGRGAGCGRLLRQRVRQRQRDGGAMPLPAVQHQPSAVALRDAAAQRQTQAQTAGQHSQPLRVEIAVKHRLHVPRGDAAAGVRHRQQHLPPLKPQGYGDGTALGREFQGVGQQIPDRLLQTDPVDRRAVTGGAALECQRHIPQGEQRCGLTAQTVQPRHHVGVFLDQRCVVQQHGRVGQVIGQAQQRIVVSVQQRRVTIQQYRQNQKLRHYQTQIANP